MKKWISKNIRQRHFLKTGIFRCLIQLTGLLHWILDILPLKAFPRTLHSASQGLQRNWLAPMMDSVSGEDSDILYKDENGIYTVGELAQRQMDSASYNDSSETMFSRNCYYSEIFKICARVGMAIGMLRSDGKAINAIQTGLPTRYIEEDAPVLRSVLAGRHTFHVKIGKRQ